MLHCFFEAKIHMKNHCIQKEPQRRSKDIQYNIYKMYDAGPPIDIIAARHNFPPEIKQAKIYTFHFLFSLLQHDKIFLFNFRVHFSRTYQQASFGNVADVSVTFY